MIPRRTHVFLLYHFSNQLCEAYFMLFPGFARYIPTTFRVFPIFSIKTLVDFPDVSRDYFQQLIRFQGSSHWFCWEFSPARRWTVGSSSNNPCWNYVEHVWQNYRLLFLNPFFDKETLVGIIIPSMVVDTRSSLLDKHGGHLCNEMGMKHISFGGCPHCIISSSVHVKHLFRNMEVSWNGCTSSIIDWDFPWNKRTSYWGTPLTMEPPHILYTSLGPLRGQIPWEKAMVSGCWWGKGFKQSYW